jgi:hypothetical protein
VIKWGGYLNKISCLGFGGRIGWLELLGTANGQELGALDHTNNLASVLDGNHRRASCELINALRNGESAVKIVAVPNAQLVLNFLNRVSEEKVGLVHNFLLWIEPVFNHPFLADELRGVIFGMIWQNDLAWDFELANFQSF